MATNPVKVALKKVSNKEYAIHSQRFFKTGKGEYGEGDVFIGVRMPQQRQVAKEFKDLSLNQITELVHSKIHEERMTGLIILVNQFKKEKDSTQRKKLYNYYVKNFKYINNWDLVDVTCQHIVGAYLENQDRKLLYQWARSKHLWTKRIAMVSSGRFIKNGEVKDLFAIAEILLEDDHDLIHKAVGWMIREAWKKQPKPAEAFLKKHCKKMPRTMLRYAIEKFPEAKRQKYLKGTV